MTDIRTTGVIGAGQMGIGIAQVAAQAGYDVILSDIDLPRAEKGKANIAKLLARAVEKEKIGQADADAALARQPLHGAFRNDDPEGFARTVALALGTRSRVENDRIVIGR